MYHNNDKREVSTDMRRSGKSARRTDRGPLFLKRVWQSARLITCGMVLQASGCTFDSNAFFGDSLAAIFDSVATTLIITALADLLGVTPSFSF